MCAESRKYAGTYTYNDTHTKTWTHSHMDTSQNGFTHRELLAAVKSVPARWAESPGRGGTSSLFLRRPRPASALSAKRAVPLRHERLPSAKRSVTPLCRESRAEPRRSAACAAWKSSVCGKALPLAGAGFMGVHGPCKQVNGVRPTALSMARGRRG